MEVLSKKLVSPVTRRKVGRRKKNPHLASIRGNDPSSLDFGGCPVGVWKLSGGCLEGIYRVSVGCLAGFWRVSICI